MRELATDSFAGNVNRPLWELTVDSFAGGGGTSEGIRAAIGRDPDIAINHDALALAMHRINHPGTRHMVEDVWHVDALGMCDGTPVGLLWMSPDCKHFSKAKGGKPREKEIRGLAWVGLRWVKSLPKRQRPRVIILENVEEFQEWGPLLADGRPCPVQKGATFQSYIGSFRAIGYAAEWRELRACDYGDPTIRKRLFVIMRRDGKPIVWPERTHGNPKDLRDATLIAAGKLKPWRTAAEIIDFSLPCPSIFETSAEIKEKLGIRANRPLADNTISRVAKGTMRYVVNAAKPFIVSINHADGKDRDRSLDEPLGTLTGKRGEALVTPFVTYAQQGGRNRDVTDPLHTLTASQKDQNALVTPHLMTMRNAQKPFSAADEPIHTITAGGANPALVAAFLAQHNTDMIGHEVDRPLSTLVAKGINQNLVAAHMLNMRGSDRRGAGADEPLQTVSAQGNHASLVAAFLAKYYGAGEPSQAADEPLHTLTTKPRHGLVTVALQGEPYVITDIGMRMLTPRERFSAQGFGPGYIIDHGILDDGSRVEFTLEQQGRMCGNSVCPGMARVLVAANYQPREVAPRDLAAMPLFAMEAAE